MIKKYKTVEFFDSVEHFGNEFGVNLGFFDSNNFVVVVYLLEKFIQSAYALDAKCTLHILDPSLGNKSKTR